METRLQKFLDAGYEDISHTKKPQYREAWSRFVVNAGEGTAVCVNCLAQFNLDLRDGRVSMGGQMSKHSRYLHVIELHFLFFPRLFSEEVCMYS